MTIALLATATAEASSIVYVRKGDIWRAAPNGGHKRVVSRLPGLFHYLEVAQDDRGRLVAVRVFGDRPRTRVWVRLRRSGRRIGRPWPTAGTHLTFHYDPARNLPGIVGPLDRRGVWTARISAPTHPCALTRRRLLARGARSPQRGPR